MAHDELLYKPFGEHALLIQWPQRVDESILEDIIAFEALIKKTFKTGWEFIPSYNSLTLIHTAAPVDMMAVTKTLTSLYAKNSVGKTEEKTLWVLPVYYGGVYALDLKALAEKHQLSVEEVIRMHTEAVYTVYAIGFLPGFMYLGGLPPQLETDRRSTPRLKVEKGAVGIAGKQTGIYPQVSPGGWNIIGNCPIPLFDVKSTPPCFVRVGDKIKFKAVSEAEYKIKKIEVDTGIYKPEKMQYHD